MRSAIPGSDMTDAQLEHVAEPECADCAVIHSVKDVTNSRRLTDSSPSMSLVG